MFSRPLHLALLGLISLSACADFQRSDDAAAAKKRMIGLSREEVLACMGPPKKKSNEGATEVWSYLSTNGRSDYNSDTIKPSGYAHLSGAHEKSFCTVNVVMKEGSVKAVHYLGPTTTHFYTKDDQCAYAVSACVGAGTD